MGTWTGFFEALGIIYAIGATVMLLIGIGVVRKPDYSEPVVVIAVATLVWPVVLAFAIAELVADITGRGD